MQGIVFDIKRFAIHDGPGLRTTVFLKGCPLGCWWCHNPEGIITTIQSVERTLKLGKKGFTETTMIGEYYSLDRLMDEIERDIIFYEESGGGVTLSGGEPLLQYEFTVGLLKRCREKEIHSCLDTSGHIDPEKFRAVFPFVDLFLFDIKHLEVTKHKTYTGVSNKRILDNLELLIREKKQVIIRYPLIPGINNSTDQLERLHRRINNRIMEIHFLPYHRVSAGKWNRLGMEYKMKGTELIPADELEKIRQMFTSLGYKISIGG